LGATQVYQSFKRPIVIKGSAIESSGREVRSIRLVNEFVN